MPTLNFLMCRRTDLLIACGSPLGSLQRVINGSCGGRPFEFDFVSSPFQVPPVRFRPEAMDGPEAQRRDASVALVSSQTVLSALSGLNLRVGVEQDAVILDDGLLHDPRRGRDSVNSPDRTNPPTERAPAGRHFVGYLHTHPFSENMRPPTPSSDWNEVPGVGFPGRDAILHFMIESNGRVWGFLRPRRTFLVGAIDAGNLLTVDPSSPDHGVCWSLP